MDTPNAFIGHPAQPTAAELTTCLGDAANLWRKVVDWAKVQDVSEEEWTSYSPRYGWSLRLKRKKRNIVYLAPCIDCFRVAFILGDKAVAAALHSDLPRRVLVELEQARRYAEGTGVRLIVRQERDLAAVRKLVQIKLAN